MPRLSDSAWAPKFSACLPAWETVIRVCKFPFPTDSLVLYDFSDGMFVVDAETDCGCIGERVTALGSTPIQAAVQKITPYLSVDNAVGVRMKAPNYLRSTEYLRAAGSCLR